MNNNPATTVETQDELNPWFYCNLPQDDDAQHLRDLYTKDGTGG